MDQAGSGKKLLSLQECVYEHSKKDTSSQIGMKTSVWLLISKMQIKSTMS